MEFNELNLIKPLLDAVKHEGYTEPTPIQVKAIPHLLDGRDLMGGAQTGTGKTAAFALPIIQKLVESPPDKRRRRVRALVLAPTRELATQIHESFIAYGRYTPIRGVVIYGGVSQNPQADALKKGVDYVVATPGRLLDLLNQRLVKLNKVEVLVLDEADRMLDMGFIKDIRKIVRELPSNRQTLLFSATIPKDIVRLAGNILDDPIMVEATPEIPTLDIIDQRVYFVEQPKKIELLKHLLENPDFFRVLVFCDTKSAVDNVEWRLNRASQKKERGKHRRKIRCAEAIHSGRSQRARERALDKFKKGKIQVLVATDIAARGIDVEDIDLVVNFDFPKEPEIYIHRIGRTGRAGAEGIAISFCSRYDRPMMRQIELLIKQHIEVVHDNPYKSEIPAPYPTVIDPKERAKNLAKSRKLRRRR